ncbi:MAG: cob(I)yrinic acid a,c-diamide adenosyltransferase [Lachnospiraceae bacterium]|nr:cob(I)yrinic acid a,c-diamide adenosyltransferase [Lachnospiraceae bacterium]
MKDDDSGIGCVHIYCGDGKGKTTCATGLCVRAAGSGMSVLYHQFLKDNNSSERSILEKIPQITVVPGKKQTKFTFQMNEEELQAVREDNDAMLDQLFETADRENYDMLAMDECIYAVDKKLLSEDKLIAHLKNKPKKLEVVMTGRNPSEKLMDCADYVSEIVKRKHPFDKGISARVGIEK